VDDSANRNDVALRGFSEMHREAAGEYHERFLLVGVNVTPPSCAWLIAPDVAASVFKADDRLKLGDMPSGITRLVRAGDPLKLLLDNDREPHAAAPYVASELCAARVMALGWRQLSSSES
jgi:hypothetical protein